MNTQQDSVAVLRELARRIRSDCAGIGDLEAQCLASLPALDSTIAALQSQQVASADRGEAVELGKLMVNSSGDFIGVKWNRPITIKNGQTVYAAPPSPAESAEGNGWTNGVRDNIGPQPLRWNITQSDPGAAPSGVSDADVDRAVGVYMEHDDYGVTRELIRAILESYAAQPQPGRVEGMRLWDSQWVNIVNHADCYRDMDKEAAVAAAVKLTEQAMAKNVRDGFPATRPTASSKEQDHG
jgi:hypothetical protein